MVYELQVKDSTDAENAPVFQNDAPLPNNEDNAKWSSDCTTEADDQCANQSNQGKENAPKLRRGIAPPPIPKDKAPYDISQLKTASGNPTKVQAGTIHASSKAPTTSSKQPPPRPPPPKIPQTSAKNVPPPRPPPPKIPQKNASKASTKTPPQTPSPPMFDPFRDEFDDDEEEPPQTPQSKVPQTFAKGNSQSPAKMAQQKNASKVSKTPPPRPPPPKFDPFYDEFKDEIYENLPPPPRPAPAGKNQVPPQTPQSKVSQTSTKKVPPPRPPPPKIPQKDASKASTKTPPQTPSPPMFDPFRDEFDDDEEEPPQTPQSKVPQTFAKGNSRSPAKMAQQKNAFSKAPPQTPSPPKFDPFHDEFDDEIYENLPPPPRPAPAGKNQVPPQTPQSKVPQTFAKGTPRSPAKMAQQKHGSKVSQSSPEPIYENLPPVWMQPQDKSANRAPPSPAPPSTPPPVPPLPTAPLWDILGTKTPASSNKKPGRNLRNANHTTEIAFHAGKLAMRLNEDLRQSRSGKRANFQRSKLVSSCKSKRKALSASDYEFMKPKVEVRDDGLLNTASPSNSCRDVRDCSPPGGPHAGSVPPRAVRVTGRLQGA